MTTDTSEKTSKRLLLSNTKQKVYKEIRISYIKMIPSDPTGLLDELFSKGRLA